MNRGATILGAGVLAIVSGAWLLKMWIDSAAASATAEQRESIGRTMQTTNMSNEVRSALQKAQQQSTPQQKRLRAERQIWEDFDDLGEGIRSREMLVAHWLRAQQLAQNLPPDDAKELETASAMAFRKRLPSYIIAGEPGRAVGPELKGLSPSDDPARCRQIAEQWMGTNIREQLASFGFESLVCGDLSLSLR